mgnify:CR=1 FL=1
MIYIEKFNETFKEFIEDLIRIFPDDPEFRLYEIAIMGALNTNELLVINIFNEHVVKPYGDKLLEKDNDFFVSHKYDHLLTMNESAMDIIDKIKSYWCEMSDDVKETVWKYFKVLILLDKKYRTLTST